MTILFWFLPLILLAALYFFLSNRADYFIFHPVRSFLPVTQPFELFFLPVPGGEKIHAAWLPPAPGKPVLLFFHGNGGNISHFEPFAQRYARRGFGVLLFDYRGFGKSEGKESERRAYEDGSAALKYLLHHKHIPPQDIVLWGYSLGNAVALETAVRFRQLPLKAVILQSPFTSAPAMGAYRATRCKTDTKRRRAVCACLRLLLWNKQFDNTQKIGQITWPMLIGYSRQDEVIPWQMSLELTLSAPAHAKKFASQTGFHGEFGWFEEAAVSFLNDLPRK